MKIGLAHIVVAIFVLAICGDIVSTILVTYQHGIEYETNPFVVYGVPLWVLFFIRIVFDVIFLYFVVVKYPMLDIYLRYFLVYFLVVFAVLQVAVVISNMQIYNTPVKDIEPVPQESRIAAYMSGIGDMEVIGAVTPKYKGFKVPVIIQYMVLNMLIFAVWLSLERHNNLMVAQNV